MAILDKKLFISEIEGKLNVYIPADTVKKILADAADVMTDYEMVRNAPDQTASDAGESTQLLDIFLDAKRIEGKSKNTIKLYRYTLTRLLEETNIPYKKVTVYHLRQFMMKEQDRGISMNTIKHNCWTYSSFFGWLFKEGLIPANPTVNIGTIKARVKESTPFTPWQIKLLEDSVNNDLELLVIEFLLSTGCRISEALSINISDINFQKQRIDVIGKGDKKRTVYFDDVTLKVMERFLKQRKDSNPALFYSSHSGTRLTANGVRAMLKRIEARSGVEDVHPHRFRHTFATNLIDRGMSVHETAIVLGHAKIDTTMRYVHTNEKNTEFVYRKCFA